MSKKLPLFYWSSKVFEKKTQENYGDILSEYIVEQCSGGEVLFFNAPKQRKKWFKKHYLMAIGSIMKYATPKATVWGSGIISKEDVFGNATFCAVRGPLSRKRIQELGYECPEVYGDPALLLSEYYTPKIAKKYALGFIPHYVDYDLVNSRYGNMEKCTVIDLINDDVFFTTDRILECDVIISSSLHGVIIAHTYGIPALWVRYSERLSGDNVKYEDYFRSVGIEPYTGELIESRLSVSSYVDKMKEEQCLPASEKIDSLKKGLLSAFPETFK
jgi:hypothetical protein